MNLQVRFDINMGGNKVRISPIIIEPYLIIPPSNEKHHWGSAGGVLSNNNAGTPQNPQTNGINPIATAATARLKGIPIRI